MHNIHYIGFMQREGLSTHQNQLKRRKAKYQSHFAMHNEQWYITQEYADFIANCANVSKQSIALKNGGNHE